MNTDRLIEQLARDLRPVRRRSRITRLVLGVAAGGAVTLILVALVLGIRPDLPAALRGFPFWMKWSYTVSLGVGAVAITARLARPEPVRLRRFWPMLLPFLLLAILGAFEMGHTPSRLWLEMWLSKTWKICPWLVLGLSAPIFIGLLWPFRKLAPTRLRAAGAAAGLTAGAWAAALYCLHCPEVSAIFVLTWYTLGIVLAAGLGALVGPRLLRW
jgi:hypothetical protein